MHAAAAPAAMMSSRPSNKPQPGKISRKRKHKLQPKMLD
jgi:hypothetical protein